MVFQAQRAVDFRFPQNMMHLGIKNKHVNFVLLSVFNVFLFCSGWNLIEIDGGAGCFYLGARTQGKEHRRNIKDVVLTWAEKGFLGFCLKTRRYIRLDGKDLCEFYIFIIF